MVTSKIERNILIKCLQITKSLWKWQQNLHPAAFSRMLKFCEAIIYMTIACFHCNDSTQTPPYMVSFEIEDIYFNTFVKSKVQNCLKPQFLHSDLFIDEDPVCWHGVLNFHNTQQCIYHQDWMELPISDSIKKTDQYDRRYVLLNIIENILCTIM